MNCSLKTQVKKELLEFKKKRIPSWELTYPAYARGKSSKVPLRGDILLLPRRDKAKTTSGLDQPASQYSSHHQDDISLSGLGIITLFPPLKTNITYPLKIDAWVPWKFLVTVSLLREKSSIFGGVGGRGGRSNPHNSTEVPLQSTMTLSRGDIGENEM